MIAEYLPIPYWRQRGETFAAQERAFVDIVSGLDFASVLDVGCGPGRLGTLVCGLRPTVTYTGIDVSPAVLGLAAIRLPGGDFHETTLADFQPDRRWGLVIASELLMHVPPDDLPAAIRTLARLSSRHVVTIDWTAEGPAAAHNFRHDYRAAFAASSLRLIDSRPVGLQTIHRLAV